MCNSAITASHSLCCCWKLHTLCQLDNTLYKLCVMVFLKSLQILEKKMCVCIMHHIAVCVFASPSSSFNTHITLLSSSSLSPPTFIVEENNLTENRNDKKCYYWLFLIDSIVLHMMWLYAVLRGKNDDFSPIWFLWS